MGEGFEKHRRVKNHIRDLIADYVRFHPGVEMFETTFLKMYRDGPEELFAEISPGIIDEIGACRIFEALTYDIFGCVTNLDHVFENCVLNDINSGTSTPEEVDFIYKIKNENALLRDDLEAGPSSKIEKIIQDNRMSGVNLKLVSKILIQKLNGSPR